MKNNQFHIIICIYYRAQGIFSHSYFESSSFLFNQTPYLQVDLENEMSRRNGCRVNRDATSKWQVHRFYVMSTCVNLLEWMTRNDKEYCDKVKRVQVLSHFWEEKL